ncbi:MAG: Transcriptional regulator, AraC family [Myxococcaceae bacterium]|nr:Transcriptional regulator, AraC family [Myxococcaceae bacterium]
MQRGLVIRACSTAAVRGGKQLSLVEARVSEAPEATVSLRWMIPFMRVTGASPSDVEILRREGISLQDFGSPDARIRHSAIMELLATSVAELGDPMLGLRAGERFEPGELGALEYAARSCINLRESILCCNRYMYLMHGAQESQLVEGDEVATWKLRITDDVPQHPAANDFVVTGAVWFARQHTGLRFPLREIHFLHREPTSESEYARIFDGAAIRYGMPCNAVVFDRSTLYLPMAQAHTGLQAAFELHAEAMLQRLRKPAQLVGQVRSLVIAQLRARDVAMTTIASQLGLSESSLRRRLAKEGSSFHEIVAEVRSELALEYLADRSLAISEVAFLLGFSHVSAFYKAFRDAQGATPAQVRARLSQSLEK